MLPYEFDVEHVSGQKLGIADYLSRSPNENASENTEETEELKTLSIQFVRYT